MSKTSVFAKLTAKEGQRDAVVAALEEMLPVVADEAGTEVYSFHLDTASPDVVWIFELYTDTDAFMAHSSSEGIGVLFTKLGDLLGAPPELSIASPLGGAKGLDA